MLFRIVQRESFQLKFQQNLRLNIYIEENSIHLLIHFHYFLIVYSIVELKLHFFFIILYNFTFNNKYKLKSCIKSLNIQVHMHLLYNPTLL